MKLRYFRARNVLSFGDEEVRIDFDSFNVIAGPNDSGKTNLFRALGLIEQALSYPEPSAEEIIFKGEKNRTLHLEVGVTLNDIELEFIAKLIICGELLQMQSGHNEGLLKVKHWKNILSNYGYQIMLKSFRNLSFILSKDKLRLSSPKIVVQLFGPPELIIDKQSQLMATDRETGNSRRLTLGEEIINSFYSKFGSPTENDVDLILQDNDKISKQSPTLNELLGGKSDNLPYWLIDLAGRSFNDYKSGLRGEPILSDLARLFDLTGLKDDNLNLLEILRQIYTLSFVRLKELRAVSNLGFSNPNSDPKEITFYGSQLAKNLFWLTNSGTTKNRAKYKKIQQIFNELTEAEFEIALCQKEIETVSEGELGVSIENQGFGGGYINNFAPLTFRKETKKKKVSEIFVQIIKDNHPVPIEQTASGIYEILFLLTAIIGENEKILLLDEPELHLHPTMQKRIFNLLSESKSKEENQIILITHSPYFVSVAEIENTWRFTSTAEGTKVHNIGQILSNLERWDKGKFAAKLSIADVRSMLFSRGAVLVEGISDKIVVDYVDRSLSKNQKGSNLDENEWQVLDIGGKESLVSSIILCRMLGVPYLCILDYDALMRKTDSIELNNREVKTSSIFSALQRINQLENLQSNADLLSEASNSEWYANSHLENLKTLALSNRIFVFSSDLEGVMQLPKTGKKRKPLKALDRIIELISQDKIPSEFCSMCDFLRKGIKESQKSPGSYLDS